MAARTWNTPDEVETPELTSFGINSVTQPKEDEPSKQQIRDQVTTSYRWGGVDEATALWHSMYYHGSDIAVVTASLNTIFLEVANNPSEGDTDIILSFFGVAGGVLKKGWRFQLQNDPTIYSVASSTTITPDIDAILAQSDGAHSIDVDVAGGKIYYTSSGADLRSCNLDGTGPINLIQSLANPVGIALDIPNGKMYWCDYSDSKIYNANLDGTGKTLIWTGSGQQRAFDIVVVGSLLYFSSPDSNELLSITTSGTNLTTINSSLSSPINLSVDSTNGYIYFTESGGNIRRCDIDGLNLITVNTATSPWAIDIDVADGQTYFSTTTPDVKRAAIDGSDTARDVLDGVIGDVKDLVLRDGSLYIITDTWIWVIDKNGYLSARFDVDPPIKANAELLGYQTNAFFFIPQNNNSARFSGDGALYAITMEEEYFTPWRTVNQPEQ